MKFRKKNLSGAYNEGYVATKSEGSKNKKLCHQVPIQCNSRIGTICKILKNVKNTHGGVILLVKLQALACQIAQSVSRVLEIFRTLPVKRS